MSKSCRQVVGFAVRKSVLPTDVERPHPSRVAVHGAMAIGQRFVNTFSKHADGRTFETTC